MPACETQDTRHDKFNKKVTSYRSTLDYAVVLILLANHSLLILIKSSSRVFPKGKYLGEEKFNLF
jgi:hypothetical protein